MPDSICSRFFNWHYHLCCISSLIHKKYNLVAMESYKSEPRPVNGLIVPQPYKDICDVFYAMYHITLIGLSAPTP